MLNFGFNSKSTGGGGTTPPVAGVPKVVSSKIYPNNSHRILVEWDVEMKGTADVRQAISIIVNGAAPIIPNAVTFNKKFMTLSDNFLQGDVITWAYDDQNASELLSSKVGDHEADNQTYGVTNGLVATAAFVSANVRASSSTQQDVEVILSDDTGYASVHSEWAIKVNGTVIPAVGVSGHGNTNFFLRFAKDVIAVGDTVLVSHLVEDSGVKKFIDKPVDNGLADEPDDDDEPMLDLDGDGLPDDIIMEAGNITISQDEDSINIDLDGDGIADITIPKPS